MQKAKSDLKQNQRIPHLGGVGVFTAFILCAVLAALYSKAFDGPFLGIILGSLAIVCVGLLDDFIELSPGAKCLGQIIATSVLVFFGVSVKIALLSSGVNIAITFLWTLSLINALNLLDIMDGLASGITVIAASAFWMVSLLSHNPQALILCGIVVGVVLGFLRYNFPPARIYLGDTGSMFCGFILAAIAMMLDYAPLKREVALVTPILVMGLPLFDTAFVVLMRFWQGRPIVKKSRDHFALRLHAAGWAIPKVLLFMYSFALFFAASALLMHKVSNRQGVVILAAITLFCIFALKKIGEIEINA
ncbi:MAG: MraY family glycosyltransferase [Candidatus Omnitrophota bacterium]